MSIIDKDKNSWEDMNVIERRRSFWDEIVQFHQFNDVIEDIKENNIADTHLSIKSHSDDSILILYVNSTYYEVTDYCTAVKPLIILTGYDKTNGTVSNIIPKELLELLSIETIVDILRLCNGNKAIDPEFTITKKYMQAELEYVL